MPVALPADLAAARLRVPPWVVLRDVGDRSVVVNLRTGQYHGLNATGRRCLAALEAAPDAASAVDELVAEYGQPRPRMERTLRTFAEGLAARGLVELEDAV